MADKQTAKEFYFNNLPAQGQVTKVVNQLEVVDTVYKDFRKEHPNYKTYDIDLDLEHFDNWFKCKC